MKKALITGITGRRRLSGGARRLVRAHGYKGFNHDE